jgi:hypothetical protein
MENIEETKVETEEVQPVGIIPDAASIPRFRWSATMRRQLFEQYQKQVDIPGDKQLIKIGDLLYVRF